MARPGTKSLKNRINNSCRFFRRNRLTGLLTGLLCLASLSRPNYVASETKPGSGISTKPELDSVLKLADEAFAGRWEPENAKKAIELYRQTTKIDPRCEECWIKLSRAHHWLGDYLVGMKIDEKKALENFLLGSAAALKAVELNPKGIGGNYWWIDNEGRYTEVKGIVGGRWSLGNALRGHFVMAQQDINYFYAGLYRYWGRVIYDIPGLVRRLIDLPLADSIYFLELAREAAPNFFMHRRYLAETFLRMGEKEKARRELEYIIHTPATIIPEMEPENKLEQKIAREIYQKYF